MKTAKNRKQNGVNMSEAALTMAIAVIAERIRGLPKADRDDLFELSKILFAAETQEEVDSAQRGFREILEQSSGRVQQFCAPDEPNGIDGWITFISRKVKEARENAKLTQTQLEEMTGLPQSHISRLENGVHSPSALTLEKIAKATGLPLTFFDPSHENDQNAE
jgi:DNA-binding XRE family transcriptional regulator